MVWYRTIIPSYLNKFPVQIADNRYRHAEHLKKKLTTIFPFQAAARRHPGSSLHHTNNSIMDAAYAQLAQIRTRLHDVPALQKFEVSLSALLFYLFFVVFSGISVLIDIHTFRLTCHLIFFVHKKRNKLTCQKNMLS